ncbi:mucin-3A [Sebastes umbrosus]|uniref:mucin-3A n=1 Tax=Sebastes umbrosus TaxID=72105 RepID=UPI0018A04F54|nr:mucin-3A [Sebastes umbrosus]
MSADDFQTKYSSVMESMLKSAIAETTKLFETMVDELKAEISQMKKENEDLKTRCSQFEEARNQPAVDSRESEPPPPPGPCDGSERRDRAVQCDLVPYRTVLVEQCQPLRHSSSQNQEQQCSYEQMEYSLQDHTYGEGTTQMAFILVKQEGSYDDSSPPPVLKQEEAEPTVVYGLAGSPQASACGTENEGPLINQECSTGEMPLPQKDEEPRVAPELPCLGMDSDLQGAQNQSSELEHSLVISLAAIEDNVKEGSEVSQKISETQGESITSIEKHPLVDAQHQSEVEPLSVVPQQCQREGKTSVNEQADVTQQQNKDVPLPLKKGEASEKLKSGVADGGPIPQPELVVQRRRGRPPKKAKRPQQPAKEIGSPSVSVASLSKGCSSEKDKPSESQQISTEMGEGAIQAPSTEGSSAVETLNTQTVQPRERHTSVTLQDAMLLVEAMNQSTAAPPQTQCAPRVGTLQTVDEVPAEPQTPLLPVETRKAAGNLPVTVTTMTQSTKEKIRVTPVTADATPTNESQAHIKGVIPKQQHTVTPANKTTSSVSLATAAVQTNVQSLQQRPTRRLITTVAPSKRGTAVSHKIIAMPRSVSSLMCHKIAALSPSQLPTVVSTVVAAQKTSILPGSTTAGLTLGTPSLSSVPPKTIYVSSRKPFPVVHSQSTATSTDPQPGTLPRPKKITIIIPRQVSAVASRKQTTVLTTKQETAKSVAPVKVSPQQMISSSHVLSVSVDTQMVLDEVATISSQKELGIFQRKSLKQTASVSEPITAPTDTCSDLNMPVGLVPTSPSLVVPATFEQNLSAVVRLSRLSFPVTAKEAVLVSSLSTDESSETQSILKDGTTQEEPSSVVISTQPSALSTDICPSLKETSVALSVNTSQMSSENCTILEEESPDSGPSTPSKVSAPVFEDSTLTIYTTQAPAVSGTADEPISNSDEEIISIAAQDASPNDPPIEEKQSAALLHLTPITTKDISDPHLQMTKAQFLAQLAVTPVTEDPKKASSNDSVDATASCTETSTNDKKRLQKNSLVAQLRSHLRAHSKARRTETNPEPRPETETPTVTPKKRRLENDSPNDKNVTREPIPLKDPGAVEDITSPKKTTDAVSPRRSGLCEAGVGHKKTVSEPTSVSSRRFTATRKSTPVSPRRSRSGANGVGSKTKISTSVSPRRSSSMKRSASPKKTKSTSMSPRRSSAIKESASAKKTKSTWVSPSTVKESASAKKTISTSVSPRRSSAIKESASAKKTKSTWVSPRRPSTVKESASAKKTIPTSVSPRRSSAIKESASAKKTKSTSVSPRRASATKENASPKKTKSTSVSSRMASSTKQSASSKKTPKISLHSRKIVSTRDVASSKIGASPKSAKTSSVRTSLSRDSASPKKTKSTVSPRTSGLSKNDTTPKVSTNEFFCRRRCTFPKDGSGSKQVQSESNSRISTDGASTKNAQSETGSPSVRLPKLVKDGVRPRKTRESLPAKKPRLIQDGTGPKKNSGLVNAKKLAKAAKAKKIAKMKNSSQSKLQIGAKPSQLAENLASCEAVRKFTATAVWTPPTMSASKTPPSGGKKETSSPRSPDHPLIYPPSISLLPIPVRAPPVVSPLQPLSVIGRRLLKNQCGECGRVLSSVAALESHVSLHAGRRPFSCTLCGKRFPDSKGLKRHGRVHRNGRIHICPQCGKGFVYRFGLTKHLLMVHRRIKPFICQICNKGFFTKRDVEAHIRMHTGEKPFHCNLCDKKFARRVELNVHLRWHNGEKRHWCPFCGKGFLDFNNLKRHKYIHTGEKPHSCPHCPKNFTQSGHLKKHVKNVHKIL